MKTQLSLSLSLCGVVILAACSPAHLETAVEPPIAADVTAIPPTARPVPKDAQTAEQFDTTTASERAAAESAVTAPGTLIGRTIASLGDPSAGGFWLETPLVSTLQNGSVKDMASGRTASVELRPIAGAESAGSRISLAAMRVLGVGLTDLPELEVYRGG